MYGVCQADQKLLLAHFVLLVYDNLLQQIRSKPKRDANGVRKSITSNCSRLVY